MNLNIFNRNKKKTKSFAVKREQIKKEAAKRKKDGSESFIKTLTGRPNFNLIFLIGIILIGSLLMNYSASAIFAHSKFEGDSFFFFKRHLFWMIFGIIIAYIAYIVPLKYYKRFGPILLIIGVILLLYMLPEAMFGKTAELSDGSVVTSGFQMPFVLTKNGATRWIDLGFSDFQPTELVKVGFIMYLCAWLTREVKKAKKGQSLLEHHLVYTVLPFLVVLGGISLLILAQRDFDGMVVIALSILVIYYVSGNDRMHTIGTLFILSFSSIIGLFALIGQEYRRVRLESFFTLFFTGKPRDTADADFQVWNGLVGIGNGWLFGRGYGESRIKQGFLQEAAYTDSIIVVIGEEFGLFGVMLVVIAFLYFGSIGFQIASKTEDKFEKLLALGLTSWIVIQAFLNIGSNLAVIPFGGMPLPFFTYGGSGMVVALASIGILLNISKKQNVKIEPGTTRVKLIGRAV